MGLFDLFTAVRSKHLSASLQWLTPLGTDVRDRAITYVRKGTGGEVIGAVAAGVRSTQVRPHEGRPALRKVVESGEIDGPGWFRLAQVWGAGGWHPYAPALPTAPGSPLDEAVNRLECYAQLRHAAGVSVVEAREVLACHAELGLEPEAAGSAVIVFEVRQFSVPSYRRIAVTGTDALLLQAPGTLAQLLGASQAEVRSAAVQRLGLAAAAVPMHLERLVELTRDSAKSVRQAALNALDQLPDPDRQAALRRAHDEAPPAVARAIAPRLERDLAPAAPDTEAPPYAPLPPTPVPPDLADRVDAAVERERVSLQRSLASSSDSAQRWLSDRLKQVEGLTRSTLTSILAEMSGAGPVGRGGARANLHLVLTVAEAHPDVTLRHLLRLAVLSDNHDPVHLACRAREVDVDLRALADALAEAVGTRERSGNRQQGSAADQVGRRLLNSWSRLRVTDDALMWPFLVEHPCPLEVALGMRPPGPDDSTYGDSTGRAIDLMEAFPVVPHRFVTRLTELALGDGVRHRVAAQDALRGGGLDVALDGLTSPVADARSTAARWLARIVTASAPAEREDVRARVVAALTQALAKERREVAQAAMLGALRALGTDLSTFLTPQALAAAATAGLRKKAPAGMDWVPLDAMPRVRWADGSDVDPSVVRWWATLAVKLKDPTGEGLIPLYVSLLDPTSRRELGSFVLGSWVGHDLQRITPEEVAAQASTQAPTRLAQYQQWAARSGSDHWKEQAARPLGEIEAQIAAEIEGTFAGTAIKAKGLLALTAGAPGHEVTEAITRYAKRHPERRAQVEVLVTAASISDDPAALQAVISVARSFKQRTVRERAVELVEQIAQRRGWTPAELADRTIPTAGFPTATEIAQARAEGEEIVDGVAILDYGPRQFAMRIADNLTLALATADGKPLKALPKAGVKDDADLAKAARAIVAAAKKELTQVVALQTARLQEAMALGRTWSAATWREAFGDHPVMRHLVSRLVWATGDLPAPAEDGEWVLPERDDAAGVVLFAPTLDGELLDAQDGEVEPGDDARVWLAHASRLDPALAQAWRERQADYGVTALLDQLDPVQPVTLAGKEISDRKGWMLTVGALKTCATRRAFALASAEDGGWIGSLVKDVGPWRVVVHITGVYPGQPVGESVAVTDLTLEHAGRTVPLEQVPPVLLAVAHADYHAIADGGAFDPEWGKRTGW